MADPFRDYGIVGPSDESRAPGAARADVVIGLLIGVAVWPFPFARAVFRDLAGSDGAGWAVHVPVLLLFAIGVAWLSSALFALLGRRTVGMYFVDLGFDAPPRLGPALGFALPWTMAGAAALVGMRTPAMRIAAKRLGSTKAEG